MQYGLNMENQNLIIDKAKNKSDGCYRFRGVAYKVHDKEVVVFAADGKVLESVFGFNVVIGKCSLYTEQAQNELKLL